MSVVVCIRILPCAESRFLKHLCQPSNSTPQEDHEERVNVPYSFILTHCRLPPDLVHLDLLGLGAAEGGPQLRVAVIPDPPLACDELL